MHTMGNQILKTFCVALFGLSLICEAREYCYESYGGSYLCEYRRSSTIFDIFGIAYGVVIGVGLVVSFFVFVFCRSRQNRLNNITTCQSFTNVGYVPAEQLAVPGQSGIMQTSPPQGTVITHTRQPMGNQPLQTHMQGQAQAGHVACGAGGTAQTSQPATQLQQMANQDQPPPYSQPI